MFVRLLIIAFVLVGSVAHSAPQLRLVQRFEQSENRVKGIADPDLALKQMNAWVLQNAVSSVKAGLTVFAHEFLKNQTNEDRVQLIERMVFEQGFLLTDHLKAAVWAISLLDAESVRGFSRFIREQLLRAIFERARLLFKDVPLNQDQLQMVWAFILQGDQKELVRDIVHKIWSENLTPVTESLRDYKLVAPLRWIFEHHVDEIQAPIFAHKITVVTTRWKNTLREMLTVTGDQPTFAQRAILYDSLKYFEHPYLRLQTAQFLIAVAGSVAELLPETSPHFLQFIESPSPALRYDTLLVLERMLGARNHDWQRYVYQAHLYWGARLQELSSTKDKTMKISESILKEWAYHQKILKRLTQGRYALIEPLKTLILEGILDDQGNSPASEEVLKMLHAGSRDGEDPLLLEAVNLVVRQVRDRDRDRENEGLRAAFLQAVEIVVDRGVDDPELLKAMHEAALNPQDGIFRHLKFSLKEKFLDHARGRLAQTDCEEFLRK